MCLAGDRSMSGTITTDCTYFGTMSLLKEATADEACDRHASMREGALIPLAAFAKKEVPAKQHYMMWVLHEPAAKSSAVMSSMFRISSAKAALAVLRICNAPKNCRRLVTSYLQVGRCFVLHSLFGA